jgi:hypothetical protein
LGSYLNTHANKYSYLRERLDENPNSVKSVQKSLGFPCHSPADKKNEEHNKGRKMQYSFESHLNAYQYTFLPSYI